MEKKVNIRLPKGKEAKNVQFNVVDGKIEVSYNLEDKFEPKDGDFLCADNDVFIYNGKQTEESFGAYVGTLRSGEIKEALTENSWSEKEVCRYATEQEKVEFLAKMEKQLHKKWNADKKCLEDIYEPKFGDIVCIEHPDAEGYLRQYVISIFPNKEIPNKSKSGFFDIACVDMQGGLQINSGAYYNHGYVREATIAEKQELFDKLKEVGKRWNPGAKQIEDIRFMPHDGEKYWFITDFSEVVYTRYNSNNNADYFRAISNNCFKTEEAAQKVAEQIKEIFKNSKAE